MAQLAGADRPARIAPAAGVRSGHLALSVACLLLVGVLCVAPVAWIVVNSFNAAGLGAFQPSVDPYREVLGNQRTLDSLVSSLILAVRAPIGVAIAFAVAWLLVRVRIPGHRLIEYSLWFSFFLPILPIAVGWTLLLDPDYGLINEAARGIAGS
jgi:iron(III) transport system permease protein